MTTPRRKSNQVAPGVEIARPDAGHHSPGESHLLPPTDVAPRRAPAPHNNLLLPRSLLIGRDHEITAIQQLLLQEQVGLLTLTGPGGIGKTRLALQVAANLLDHFVDGVYVVSLAPIRDPDLVVAAIAHTLGVHEAPGHALQERLQGYLQDKQQLLVLDNFEQILAAAPLVSALLAACRRLKVLVTSRVTLHLYGEQEFPVPPLALPDSQRLIRLAKEPTAGLMEFAAVDLFCRRARAVKPDFVLTPGNAADVARICIGLDGLPLAVELAAAKLKLFSPQALLARFDQRLTLLKDGPHDQPERQRTLRNEIAWSYDLLTAEQQTLFRRLAVFVGSFSLEAAQAVGNPSAGSGQALGADLLDDVAALVDHNLMKQIEQAGQETHFGMLETIREYGLEQLEASGEAEAIRRHHVLFFLALAEATAPMFDSSDLAVGSTRLTLEYANLRVALGWCQQDASRTEIGIRLSVALRDFWILNGYWGEGRHWFEAALARTTMAERTARKVQSLLGTGCVATMQGDYAMACVWLEQGMSLASELGMQRYVVQALTYLSFVAQGQHDDYLAYAYLQQALAISRQLDDKIRIAENLLFLGSLACKKHDYVDAQALYEEGLAIFQAIGDDWSIANIRVNLGQLAQAQGDYAQAGALFRDSLTRWRAIGTLQWKGIAECLEGLAGLCALQQHFVEAAHLFGAAEGLQQALSPFFGNATGDEIAVLRLHLGEDAFTAAWAHGRSWTSQQAVDYALALPDRSVTRPDPVLSTRVSYPAGLTAREVEVLQLLAQGLTYAQIAEKLFVTRRTVNGHLTSIYSKLAVNGRAAATRFAIAHHLV